MPIPIIDLGVIDRAPSGEVLAAIDEAARTIGVVQVLGHGVPQDLIDEHDRRTTALLARPRQDKIDLASPSGHPYRGWRQWPDDLGRLELERYMVARFDDADDAIAAGVDPERARDEYVHVNVWPDDDPGYRDLVIELRAEIVAFAERLLGIYAQALGLPADSFPSVGPDTTAVTYNKYPTWTWPDDATDEDKLLLLEHADGNTITVLHQAGGYPGLQVQLPDGSWTPVPVVDRALQVFNGGLMSRWTNERWVPGRHRVVAGGTQVRHSTAFFYSPGFETVVEPFRTLLDDGEEALYDPVTIGDHSDARTDDYLRVFARPDQIEAWENRTRFVADVREDEAVTAP